MTGAVFDRNGLEVLSREECLDLLAGTPVGRVVVSSNALPAAFPVNFALLDGDVVFRTGAGSKLAKALEEAVVAFEADAFDPKLASGWSVLIQGRASVLTSAEALERAGHLNLQAWALDTRPYFVRIRSELISGRRLVRIEPLVALAARSAG